MKNENKYETPILTLISFEREDIIRTSGSFGKGYGEENGDNWFENL